MGFGTYDETEQENQEVDASEMDTSDDAEKAEYDGDAEIDFADADTDDLVDQLEDM